MTQGHNELSTSEWGRSLTHSREEPVYATHLGQRLKLVWVNAYGLNSIKTTYLFSPSLITKI
eukprot:snap_masked-scaffold_57-processed-gene-1.20-mRNA-1 protein AED:1.00 eAED:1.00 QI:0/-1/0/0/-1/1/1/0/61